MTHKPQRWCVLGAGMVGRAVVYYAIKFYEADVLLCEPNFNQFFAAKKMLRTLLTAEELERLQMSIIYPKKYDEKEHISQFFKWSDVVVSCAPYTANLEFAKLAAECGVPYCDLGGSPSVVASQRDFASGANIKTALVPDCGLSPGISNILAGHFARCGWDIVRVRCGGNPLLPPDPEENPWGYKLVFSPDGLAEEYTGIATAIQNGVCVPVRALSSISEYDAFFESSPTSNNSPLTADYLLRCGVMEYDYQTLRYRGHFQKVIDDCADSLGNAEALAKKIRERAELIFDRAKDSDRVDLNISCARTKNPGDKISVTYRFLGDPVTLFTAMERSTAIGIAVVADHLTRDAVEGFKLPEEFMSAYNVYHGLIRCDLME